MSRNAKVLMTITGGVAALSLVLVLVFATTASGRSDEAPAPQAAAQADKPAAEPETAPSSELRVVKTSEVCMVNDTFFAREQIPVEVEDQTYYGCCEGCKTRLAEDAGIRLAVDPATGKTVDKAAAVIAARPDGSVLYFTSEETFESYQESKETHKQE